MIELIFYFVFAHLSPEYNRGLYPHWSDLDRDCMNTRHELLYRQSLNDATLDEKQCKVRAGEWADFYSGKLLQDVSKIDIDHVISLKEAHEGGAWAWSKKKRRQFANDPLNLVITSRDINRTKAANSPEEWLPESHFGKCRYLERRVQVYLKYNLKLEGEELKATVIGLKGCQV